MTWRRNNSKYERNSKKSQKLKKVAEKPFRFFNTEIQSVFIKNVAGCGRIVGFTHTLYYYKKTSLPFARKNGTF